MSSLTLRSLVCAALWLTAGAHAQVPSFSKVFGPDTIGAGSTTTLTFSIENLTGTPAIDLAFTDVLPAGMTIATPARLESSFSVGVVTASAGGNTISLSEGRLSGNTTETIRVDVVASPIGALLSSSGALTSSAGNSGSAVATLTVAADRPGINAGFSPDTVSFGTASRLRLKFVNTANAADADFMTITVQLPAGLVVATPSNLSHDCADVFPPFVSAVSGTEFITLSSGFVPAGGLCVLDVDVIATVAGDFEVITSELINGFPPGVSCGFAGAPLSVAPTGAGGFSKYFTNDPVAPGGTVELEYTIRNLDHDDPLTGISFSDDLDAALSGLVVTSPGMLNVCGPGSILSTSSPLTLTGGNLPPGGVCSFSVSLQVPPGTAPGAYASTSGTLTADGGVTLSGASDTLGVGAVPVLTKTFLGGPVTAGGSTTLEFSITNTSPTFAATNISFTDPMHEFMQGASVSGLPATGFCGAGSNLTLSEAQGNLLLVMTGGSLPAGGNCTFSVTVDAPVGASPGIYTNVTTPIEATIDGDNLIGPPAVADLELLGAPLLIREFLDDPVFPGDTVTLQYYLEHSAQASSDATSISFTDDLAALLPGLTALGLPDVNVCGPGSILSGTGLVSFSGGTLEPGDDCKFVVTLQVPTDAAVGDYLSLSSPVSAVVGGVATSESPASDVLTIASPVWTDLGNGLPGTGELTPRLQGFGAQLGDDPLQILLTDALPGATATLVVGIVNLSAPFKGGVLVPFPTFLIPLPVNGLGEIDINATWPAGLPGGIDVYYQYWVSDPGGFFGFAASNALQSTTP